AREVTTHHPQTLAGRALGPSDSRPGRGERKIEGAAHPRNFVLFRELGDGLEHGRQQVRVLVRVEMRGLQPGVEDAPYLRLQLVVDTNAARHNGACELSDGRREGRVADKHQM